MASLPCASTPPRVMFSTSEPRWFSRTPPMLGQMMTLLFSLMTSSSSRRSACSRVSAPLCEVGDEVREEQLVDAARGDAAAGAVADDGGVLGEPERLHGLGEAARREPRHAAAALGDGLELGAALGVAGRRPPRRGPAPRTARRRRASPRRSARRSAGTRARPPSWRAPAARRPAAWMPEKPRPQHVLVAQHDVRLGVGAAAAPLEVVSGAGAHRAQQPRQARREASAVARARPGRCRRARSSTTSRTSERSAEAAQLAADLPGREVELAREVVRLERGDLRVAHRLALPVGDELVEQQALVRRLDAVAEAPSARRRGARRRR